MNYMEGPQAMVRGGTTTTSTSTPAWRSHHSPNYTRGGKVGWALVAGSWELGAGHCASADVIFSLDAIAETYRMISTV